MIVSLHDGDGDVAGGMGINNGVEDDIVEWYRRVGSVSSPAAVEVEVELLRAELEVERRMRREAEAVGEALAAELEEERRRRGAAEAEVAEMRAEVERALEELDEERRMLRVAELWREERVQMKLADAMAAMEHKLQQIAAADDNKSSSPTSTGNSSPTNHHGKQISQPQVLRREVTRGGENPHIARGIKGFVEFPTAAKVRRPRREERDQRVDLVSNLECQRAQLRALTRRRHRDPPTGVGLAVASDSFFV